ncbi:MAG: hypothetical protein HPY79_04705 [Bacteroidales bacterium]|nr:hypothetical protein [Bacteroidales bacterium]
MSKKALSEQIIQQTIDTLSAYCGNDKNRLSLIEKGVKQAAALWDTTDGNDAVFFDFCKNNYAKDDFARKVLFEKISHNLEVLYGNFNRITIELLKPLHLSGHDIQPIDEMFGSYNVGAHLTDDLFANKVAFITILNFPNFTLKEKNELGQQWSRLEWAYARLGDVFTSRVPSHILQHMNNVLTKADTYISEYNIYMGKVIDNNKQHLFTPDMKLITHWGLRDELKSNYADKEKGLNKQKIIYEIMKHIVYQDIPQEVINNDQYDWNPFENKIYAGNTMINSKAEPNTRYEHLLNIFHAMQMIDPYSPQYPTYIQRKFEGEMEMPQEEVEQLFINFITSPQIKQVAELISKRLGRSLEPFDIWYDGFKSRSAISEDILTEKTRKLFPNTTAVQNYLPTILTKLGFDKNKAQEIVSHITVDASRGAGHAWGSEMRGDNARLRTRIGEKGMDYKGYNIAVHEFGHNVEQTLSLYDVDYYMLKGIPNTAFTEALAFIFQKRDLDLLDMKDNSQEKFSMMTLDNVWACYEIMGVSLVDMNVWKWLYAHPNATKEDLKNQVITIAKDIWNKYYAPIFGKKDEPILAIYSHMIDAPLYLSAYPIGHVIDFQIESYIKDKSFAKEITRIYTQGRLTPDIWMKKAVGQPISTDPMLKAADEALKIIK